MMAAQDLPLVTASTVYIVRIELQMECAYVMRVGQVLTVVCIKRNMRAVIRDDTPELARVFMIAGAESKTLRQTTTTFAYVIADSPEKTALSNRRIVDRVILVVSYALGRMNMSE